MDNIKNENEQSTNEVKESKVQPSDDDKKIIEIVKEVMKEYNNNWEKERQQLLDLAFRREKENKQEQEQEQKTKKLSDF